MYFQTFPVNMFPDPNVEGPDSIHWLYNTMSNVYSHWLPEESQQRTIKDGGYYSVTIKYKLTLKFKSLTLHIKYLSF